MTFDDTTPTDQILTRMVELIHAAMERKHGSTWNYGVGSSADYDPKSNEALLRREGKI